MSVTPGVVLEQADPLLVDTHTGAPISEPGDGLGTDKLAGVIPGPFEQ